MGVDIEMDVPVPTGAIPSDQQVEELSLPLETSVSGDVQMPPSEMPEFLLDMDAAYTGQDLDLALSGEDGSISLSVDPETVKVIRMDGTDDYMELRNRPSIEGVVLEGDKTFEELGLQELDNLEILGIFNRIL